VHHWTRFDHDYVRSSWMYACRKSEGAIGAYRVRRVDIFCSQSQRQPTRTYPHPMHVSIDRYGQVGRTGETACRHDNESC
jgi:hypothetical protein